VRPPDYWRFDTLTDPQRHCSKPKRYVHVTAQAYEQNVFTNAWIMCPIQPHTDVNHVYDATGKLIEVPRRKADFKKWQVPFSNETFILGQISKSLKDLAPEYLSITFDIRV
jgi:hypothetical protein